MRASVGRFNAWARLNPLLLAAFAAAVGLLIAEYGAIDSRSACGAALVLTVLALMWRRGWLALVACIGGFAALHALQLEATFRHPLRAMLLSQAEGRAVVTVRGSLRPDHESRVLPNRANAAIVFHSVVFEDGRSIQQTGELLVRLPRGVSFPGAGQYELRGELHVPRVRMNPGGFDSETHSLRRGFVGRIDAEAVRVLPGRGEPLRCALLDAAEASRRWIAERLTRGIAHDAATAGVIRAMALGVAEEAQEEVEEAFRDSGTLHVFAVSGLHVGLLGIIIGQMLRMLRQRRSRVVVAMITAVFVYAFITGWRPSAARSAWMIAVMLLSTLADRRSSLQNSLGLAALLVLVADSHQLFLAGFQLSFGVLWGISMWSDSLSEKLRPWMELDPFLPDRHASWWQLRMRDTRRWIGGNLGVSLAAWLGSVPFIWLHFQSITPVAVVANLVLVPLSTLSLAVTCMGMISAALHLSGLLSTINCANWALARAMIYCAAWFAALPGANLHVSSTPRSAEVFATWHVLDMPDGGAANHLRVDGRDWLLDTGHTQDYRSQLKPALRHAGVNHLEGIFLSHNDGDHIGAVEAVAPDFGHPPLYLSVVEQEMAAPANSVLHSLQCGSLAPLLKALPTDAGLCPGADEKNTRLICLHPGTHARTGRGDDRAMVLRADLHGWRLLWTSDAGWNTEQALLESGADIRCDVLIQSHCESDDAGSPEFLQKAAPRVVIHAAEPGRLMLKMPARLESWCTAQRVPLLNPSATGGIRIELQADEMRVQPLRGAAELALRRKQAVAVE